MKYYSLSKLIQKIEHPKPEPVSEAAMVKRINRRLRKYGRTLRKSRGLQSKHELGRYYIHDFEGNCIARKHVDLRSLCHEENVRKEYEFVVSE